MTTNPNTTESADLDAESAPDAETAEDGHVGDGAGDNPNAEAAKYRRQLRDAEAARDKALGQLDALRRQAAEDATALVKPSALWAAGIDVNDLYDEDGRLDRDALAAAVTTATETLGLARVWRGMTPNPGQGVRESDPPETSWGSFLGSST